MSEISVGMDGVWVPLEQVPHYLRSITDKVFIEVSHACIKQKFAIFPKRCNHSDNPIWLTTYYQAQRSGGYPDGNVVRNYSKNSYLMLKLAS